MSSLVSLSACDFRPTGHRRWVAPPADMQQSKQDQAKASSSLRCGWFDGRQHPCHPAGPAPCCSKEGFCGKTHKHCYGPGTIDYRRSVKCLRWDQLAPLNPEKKSKKSSESSQMKTPSSYSPAPSLTDCPPTSHCVTYRDPAYPDLIRHGCAYHFFGILDESRYGSDVSCCNFDGFSTIAGSSSNTAPICLCQGDLCNNEIRHFKPRPDLKAKSQDLYCYFNHPNHPENELHVVGCMAEGDRCIALRDDNGKHVYSCLSHLKSKFHSVLGRSRLPRATCLTLVNNDNVKNDLKLPVCVCDTPKCNRPLQLIPDGHKLIDVDPTEYVVRTDFHYLYEEKRRR